MRIHEIIHRQPSIMFILGSISPDAIHMREDAKKEDKWFTHLHCGDKDAMIPNTKEFLDKYLKLYRDWDRIEFVKGYATHIITDFYWLSTVYKTFKERLPKDLSKADISKKYYTDTDQIDFNIYRSREWRPAIWRQLRETQAFDFGNLLTGEEIDKWKLRTLTFFEDSSKEPKITPIYISEKEVESFMDDAANYIIQLFNTWDIELS